MNTISGCEEMKEYEVLTIYDRDHNKVGVIDRYTSLIWVRRFQDAGEFELILPWRSLYKEIMQPFFFIERENGLSGGNYYEEMIIEKISVTQSAGDGIVMTVSGRDLTSILAWRIIYSVDESSNIHPDTYTAFAWISALVNECFGEGAYKPRRLLNKSGEIGYTMYDRTNDKDARVRACEAHVSLLEVISDFCKSQGYGIYILFDGTDYGIYVYKPEDKSSTVIFSEKFDNLADIEYTNDYTDYGNVARISHDGQRYITVPGGADTKRDERYWGLNRRETAFSVELLGEPESIPNSLKVIGTDKLSKKRNVYNISANLIQTGQFIYNKDYMLGDIVRVQTSFGPEMNAQITEVAESWDASGYSIVPTLGNFEILEYDITGGEA